MSPSSSLDAAIMDVAFGAKGFEDFKLDVPGAHVRLRPHTEDNRVHIRGFVPDADPETAQEVFDRRGISTHQLSDRLHVYGDLNSAAMEDWQWRHTHRQAVHLNVYLPPDLDATVQTPGGTVDASDLTSTVDLSISGGSAHIERPRGALHVRGSGGTLAIQDGSGFPLDLQWSAGHVTLERIEGPSTTLQARAAPTTLHDVHGPVDLSVHGAPLELRGVDGPGEAQVRGGALTYRGAPTRDMSLTTVGGPLHTHLPAAHSAVLTLAGTQVALDDAFAFEGTQTSRRIEGALNGGGPRLHLRAVKGVASCRPQ